MPSPPTAETLSELLRRVFGHSDFRPHQRPVCEAAFDGRDVLLVMPTGAGKSLCYQLPALARRAHPGPGQAAGTALVISPLIALMDDQAARLSALGLSVARIHSGLSRDEARQACRDYLSGSLDFLFIAPERMRVPGFPEMLARRKPSLVAIDEAHCISAWGHDFRPDYRTLGQYLSELRPAPIVALTATATPTVQRDIALQLHLQRPAVFITGFRRHNLAIQAVELSRPQRPDFALQLLRDAASRPAIVYAGSRKDAEEYAARLHRHFPTSAYHAGLDPATRDRVQRAFLSGRLDVVVATVAFGMGVDKADIRTVLHVALPGSVEAFYQEIGRAGRDGLPARTVLLHSFADRRLQEFFLDKNYPPIADLERVALCLEPDFTTVDVLHNALLKKREAIDRDTLGRTLEKLLVAGVAEMDIHGDVRRADAGMSSTAPDAADPASGGRSSTMPPASVQGGAEPPRWKSAYESQIAVRRSQIDRMIAFAESSTCRMASLVRHFGDTSDTATTCGLCDICNPADGSAAHSAHRPTAEERSWLRQILSALEPRSTSTGKLFTDLRITQDRNDFDTLLHGLARAGLLTLANDTFTNPEGRDITYKKAVITHEGRTPDDATLDTVWLRSTLADSPSRKKSIGRASAPTARDAVSSRPKRSAVERPAVVSAPKPLSDAAEALFNRLRNWRTEQARPSKTPAFLILSDAVLRAIAQAAPQNLTALHAVPGIGPAKADRYGADLIALCREAAPGDRPAAQHSPRPRQNSALRSEALRDSGLLSKAQPGRRASKSSAPPIEQPVQAQPSAAVQAQTSAATAARTASAVTQNKRPAAPPPAPALTPIQLALEGRLKDWRREVARTAGLPTFFILSDTLLRTVVQAAPRTLADLSRIPGLPPEKIDRFGPTLLTLCSG